MRKKTLAAAALLAVVPLTLTACGTDSGDSGSPVSVVSEETGARQAATVLDKPFEKPDLVLTDTAGKPYDFREQTAGRPTLIYFGYTHCPDVCPLTMNNIAVARSSCPRNSRTSCGSCSSPPTPSGTPPPSSASGSRASTPQVVGLTGDFATIQAGARTLGISIDPPRKDENGKTVSDHGTQVIAFSPKTDGGYVLYGEDATVEDYTQDLPKIIKGENP